MRKPAFLLLLLSLRGYAQHPEVDAFLLQPDVTPVEIFELTGAGTLGKIGGDPTAKLDATAVQATDELEWVETREYYPKVKLPAWSRLYVTPFDAHWQIKPEFKA